VPDGTPVPDTLAATIVAALDRLARGQRTFRQAAASEHGLTPLQIEILATVAAGPPPEPLVGLLARELGVTQPRADEADRRRSILSLTHQGSTVVGRVASAERRIVEAVAGAAPADQEAAVVVLLGLIARFVDAGIIEVARTCMTCRYHELAAGRHHCALLGVDLVPATLRVNCPEHEPSNAA
jgi:DNA-binding MarR family transcriptional regulator